MLIGLVKAGIGSVLQLPVSQKLAGSALLRVAKIVGEHFLNSSHELAVAYRECLVQALIAIASGLATEAELSGMLNRLKKLGESSYLANFRRSSRQTMCSHLRRGTDTGCLPRRWSNSVRTAWCIANN